MPVNWDAPNKICPVCRGRGKVELEDASGAPRQEVTCGYCKGTGKPTWVAEKKAVRIHNHAANRLIAIGATGLYTIWLYHASHWAFWSNGQGGNRLGLMGLWLLCLLAWLVVFAFFPKQKRRRSRHAPGFTTDRERNSAAALGAGIALKKGFENWEQKHRG